VLFENVQKGDVNKWSERHRTMVKALLQGTTKVRTVDVTVEDILPPIEKRIGTMNAADFPPPVAVQ
jgi:hypothetical protein